MLPLKSKAGILKAGFHSVRFSLSQWLGKLSPEMDASAHDWHPSNPTAKSYG